MRGAGGSLIVLALVALGAARCTYSPDFPSGTLKCSSVSSCPEGYACDHPSNLCYKNGESPSGVAGAGGSTTGKAGAGGSTGTAGAGGSIGTAGAGGSIGTAGAGGKGPPCAGSCTIKIDGTLTNANAPVATPPADNKFIGHWVFQSGSTESVSCSDGSDKTNDLATDFVDITRTPGVSATLTGSYFCDWNLAGTPVLNPTMTDIKPNQSCSRVTMDATTGSTKFTWHGTTFTFKTDDSKTGTLGSMIGVDYVDDASKTGCSP
jgi:hypothetical protein